ncbi:unnamed protein product [Protopolystoma xenopodis]|uniref:Elongation of very long chain fatty acids protein n=1 Tax=Protopolystoma xenopodis TaxID=117903 RepID=A0A448WD87_9PLAT|nr:unnamed protein product [Protopolystoma xenopodis]
MQSPLAELKLPLRLRLLPDRPDSRTDHLPLMQSWWPTVAISLLYVVVVWAWRNRLLDGRISPARRRRGAAVGVGAGVGGAGGQSMLPIVGYNAAMVVYNAYVLKECIFVAHRLGYGLKCTDYTYTDSPDFRRLIQLGWFFYFSKIIEFSDTAFFLWRGKVDQVTFLHVFHHANMPPAIWLGLRYLPGMLFLSIPIRPPPFESWQPEGWSIWPGSRQNLQES